MGGQRYTMDPEKCHAVQDFGRGIWPYRSFWNWAVCTGVQGGDRIGVNMGARWTTGTGANENGICVNGRLYKIMEDLCWSYEPSDWMRPWHIRSDHSDMVDLTLHPVVVNRSKIEPRRPRQRRCLLLRALEGRHPVRRQRGRDRRLDRLGGGVRAPVVSGVPALEIAAEAEGAGAADGVVVAPLLGRDLVGRDPAEPVSLEEARHSLGRRDGDDEAATELSRAIAREVHQVGADALTEKTRERVERRDLADSGLPVGTAGRRCPPDGAPPRRRRSRWSSTRSICSGERGAR